MALLSVAAEYTSGGTKMRGPCERTALTRPPQQFHILRYVVFLGLWLGSFLAAAGINSLLLPVDSSSVALFEDFQGSDCSVDSTVVTTITTTLMSEFGDGSLLSWLGASYFIANAWIQPLCGQLTDVYSRRTGLLWSISTFTIGNSLSAISTSSSMLITGRFVAGIGGGSFIVITTMVANDLVESRSRGLYQGCTNLIYALGHSSGGIFSALITEKFSWQWAFLSLVGLSLGTWAFLSVAMPTKITASREQQPDDDSTKQVDFQGALYSSVATFLLLFCLNDVAFSIPFPWVRSIVILAGAGGFCFLFIRHSLKFAHPVLPLRLLKSKPILSGCLINLCACCCFTVAEFFLPIIGQLHRRQPDDIFHASLILLPLSAGAALGSMLAGVALLYYNYPRAISVCGSALVFIASVIQATLIYPDLVDLGHMVDVVMILSTLTCGLGFGILMTSSLVAVVLSLGDQQDSARATSLLFTFRSFGSAVGLASGSLTCQWVLRWALARSSLLVDEELLHRVLQSPMAMFHLDPRLSEVVLAAYLQSIALVLFSCAGLAMIGLLLAVFLLPQIG